MNIFNRVPGLSSPVSLSPSPWRVIGSVEPQTFLLQGNSDTKCITLQTPLVISRKFMKCIPFFVLLSQVLIHE